MLSQMAQVLQTAPSAVEFQLDLLPDGTLGDALSLGIRFDIARPGLVRSSFTDGADARVMGLLESWGVADERWKQGVDMTVAHALPVNLHDGTPGRYGIMIMPQWVKVRWKAAKLRPAKLYHLATAGLMR